MIWGRMKSCNTTLCVVFVAIKEEKRSLGRVNWSVTVHKLL